MSNASLLAAFALEEPKRYSCQLMSSIRDDKTGRPANSPFLVGRGWCFWAHCSRPGRPNPRSPSFFLKKIKFILGGPLFLYFLKFFWVLGGPARFWPINPPKWASPPTHRRGGARYTSGARFQKRVDPLLAGQWRGGGGPSRFAIPIQHGD